MSTVGVGVGANSTCRRRRGQAFIEYGVLLGLVAAAFGGMYFYAKRGIQGKLKTAADQLSPFARDPGGDADGEKAQVAGMRYESGERTSQVVAVGKVLARSSGMRGVVNQPINTRHQAGGGVVVSYQNATISNSGALGGGGSSHSEVVIDVR